MTNNKQNSILGKSILQAGIGLLIFGILLVLLWLIVLGLEKIGIIFTIDKNDLSLVLAILATIGTAMYILNTNQFEKKRDEEKKQTDLLRILSEELDFLSENLKGYQKTFSKPNHYPLYELWKIDTSLYFSNLSHKINDKETLELKKNLMKIKDKIILINNFKIEMKDLEVKRGNEELIKAINPGEKIRSQVITIIDEEILPIINDSKKIISSINNPI
ncbi:MAG: hypothetical protein WCX73_04930 [Candidatus Pacearchaeota archaeon]|jgi:hypothetical protein